MEYGMTPVKAFYR